MELGPNSPILSIFNNADSTSQKNGARHGSKTHDGKNQQRRGDTRASALRRKHTAEKVANAILQQELNRDAEAMNVTLAASKKELLTNEPSHRLVSHPRPCGV